MLCCLDGEQMLHELCSSEEEQACVEESHSVENETVGILINNHLPLDYSAQGYSEEDSRLSGHNYSGHNSPYQSNSPRVSLAQGYPPSTGFDSEAYYDSFSSINGSYLSDRHCPQLTGSGPSSLPAMGRYCVCVCACSCHNEREVHCTASAPDRILLSLPEQYSNDGYGSSPDDICSGQIEGL